MELIYSKIEPDRLLHIIHRVENFFNIEDGHRRDVVGEKEFIQLSALNMDEGHTFKIHFKMRLRIFNILIRINYIYIRR